MANYTVSRSTGITYSVISGSGGTNPFIWRNQSGGATNDDNRSFFTPIGFDFWYEGIRYTYFSASTNGFIDFSSSTNAGTAGSAYGPANGNEFSAGGAGGTMLALAPIYDDLWPSNQGTTILSNSIVYKVSGTEPSRVLTVEWTGMEKFKSAPYWTTPPNLNFQVKIYETNGRIEFVYGTMTQGTATFDYASGINDYWTPAAAPTASQLLSQQTANTTTFNNTPQNALNTVPASSTMIQFTPPAPSSAPSALSFSNVSKTSMDLNWNDNSSNELGYVILYSTNASNYTFVTQLAANSTSTTVSGLLSGTTYYWKVHAVTEGDLGTAATGTQSTSASGTIVSVATGNWNTPATWNCTCVPTAGDIVTIANSHNVTLDVNGVCKSLTVGQGSSGQLTIGNNATGRNLVISGDLTISNSATVTNGAANATHNMTVTGNILNNGIFNLSPTANRLCNLTINSSAGAAFSGTGSTTYLNRLTVSLGNSSSNILDVSTSTFGVRPTNFLTLNNGTFKLSAPSGTLNMFTGASTLSTTTSIWLNNAASTLIIGNTLTNMNNLRVSAGTFSVGDAANENLIVNGGSVIIDGGTVIVAGRFARSGLTARIDFNLSAGSLIVGAVGSTTGNEAVFRLDEPGSSFTMSGGSIVLRRSGNNNLGYVNTSTTNVSVTGGTLFINDASSPASQTITISSAIPVYNLVTGSVVAVTASLLTNSLIVNNALNIATGTLIANNLPIVLGGNWTNNGLFTAGTSTVTFNGSNAQNIDGISTTTFNTLSISNTSTAGITCLAPVDITASLNLNNGILYTSSGNILSLENTAGSTSGSSSSHVNGPMTKSGTTAYVFPVGKGGRWARIGIGVPSGATTFMAEYFNTGFGNYGGTPTQTPPLNNVSRIEYWQLDRTAGSGDAQVSLYWESASFSDINDCSTTDLRIAHWNTATSKWENNNNSVTTAGTCTGSSAGSITTNAVVTAFSPFTFGSLSSFVNPLPVELLDFSVHLSSKQEAILLWSTSSEKNSDYFELQRAQDASNFKELARIPAKGNSNVQTSYAYTDQMTPEGISYYRLKIMDKDGNYKYSFINSVERVKELELSIYPNPSDCGAVWIFWDETVNTYATVVLTDELGRMVFKENIMAGKSGTSPLMLPPELFPGAYILNIQIGNKQVNSKLLLANLK